MFEMFPNLRTISLSGKFTMQPQFQLTCDIRKSSQTADERWFEYPVRVQPHHTDYAGVVWHGSYIVWMEEARVEYLHSIGLDYANLVALGCDLPVVHLSIRYHRPVRMGMVAVVRTRMISRVGGVRLDWDHKIQSLDGQENYVTAQVNLVAVDREKSTITRQLPPSMVDILRRRCDRVN